MQQLLIRRQPFFHFQLPLVYVDKIRQLSMQMITIVGGCAITTTTYFERGDHRIDLAVKPSDFCNSLIFGEKRLQKRASGFLFNKDGDLLQ